MQLLNNNPAPRIRSSEGCTVLPCGCAHTERTWVQMCGPHYADDNALHETARIAHLATLREVTP